MERKVTIEEPQVYQEDYQMRMFQVNIFEKFLAVKGRGVDGTSYYDYNVSGKISLQALYERNKITGRDVRNFLGSLSVAIREAESYLLDIHCILLKPEYIFYEKEQFFFCYYPKAKQDLWEEFHSLTEYFVRQADYEDKEGVRMIFVLHKETMEENYSLEKVIQACEEERQKDTPQVSVALTKEKTVSVQEEPRAIRSYDTTDHDWIREQHQGKVIMEETENMWIPVKRFLNRRKKPKWGDWDGLYIEEEEL